MNTKEDMVDLKKPVATKCSKEEVCGRMFSFMNSLKLTHWNITGDGSYAQHMALDQAIDDLSDILDRIVETSFAAKGEINITIPVTKLPTNIVDHCKQMFSYTESHRKDFDDTFTQAIIDDYQEAIKALMYRLIRLQ